MRSRLSTARILLGAGLLVAVCVSPGDVRAGDFQCFENYFIPDGSDEEVVVDFADLSEWVTTYYMRTSGDRVPGVWAWSGIDDDWRMNTADWDSVPGGAVIPGVEFLDVYELVRGRRPRPNTSFVVRMALTSSNVDEPNLVNTHCQASIRIRYVGPMLDEIPEIDLDAYVERLEQVSLPDTR